MKKAWWKESVIYQIYPRSFYDSNGDGIGDLKGITQKLPYLAELGVDVLWLSPIFKSPNDDNGYDISDYYNIMDEFGTMSDFDEMLSQAHALGLKIVLDLVVNHSSDEHSWFQESRKSADNPYSDYYIWQKEKPNNWQAFFGGDAWTYDEVRGEYYLHYFTVKQPDLNWENEKLRNEIHQLMKFWFDKGIDGFRMDVIPFISKNWDFPPATSDNYMETVTNIYANGPRLHEFLNEMYEKVTSNYDVFTVGEGVGVPKELANLYVGKNRRELNMIYHFDHLFLGLKNGNRFDFEDWKLTELKAAFREWHEALGDDGWVNLCLDNHDFPRMLSRYGNDGTYRNESAKLLAIMLLTMRGTPCIYQGTEIGMGNVAFPSLADYDDVETKNFIKIKSAEGMPEKEMLWRVQKGGRDNARTPVQWDDSENAGFTTGQPWLKLNPNYKEINVKNALGEKNSIFYFYQKLLSLRKEHKTLIYGDYHEIIPDHEDIYAYQRFDENNKYLVVLNFSEKEISLKYLTGLINAEIIIANYNDVKVDFLNPWEGRVYKID
ncbi:MAG: alpha-glucosidase [Bacteroidota bacterium]